MFCAICFSECTEVLALRAAADTFKLLFYSLVVLRFYFYLSNNDCHKYIRRLTACCNSNRCSHRKLLFPVLEHLSSVYISQLPARFAQKLRE
jgi:hypothetical protein